MGAAPGCPPIGIACATGGAPASAPGCSCGRGCVLCAYPAGTAAATGAASIGAAIVIAVPSPTTGAAVAATDPPHATDVSAANHACCCCWPRQSSSHCDAPGCIMVACSGGLRGAWLLTRRQKGRPCTCAVSTRQPGTKMPP